VRRFSLNIPLPPLTEDGLMAKSHRQWRERQADEISARDERSKTRRQETISKAERAIDQFYEEYSTKRERQIRENKYASRILIQPFFFDILVVQGLGSRVSRIAN
jgi:Clathrin light chain